MHYKKLLSPFFLFVLITVVFFYQVFFRGYSAFPGDLLISEYNPWRSFSYLGYNPGSFPNKAQYFDTIRQLYPWRTVTTMQLKKGEVPLWNPYSFSGAPLLANIQSAVFYPGTLFYLLLPQIIAWDITIILQPLLACIFMYLFIKERGVGKQGSMFGAIAYGYSLYMTVFLEYNTIGHLVMLLPASLWLFEKIQQTRKKLYILLFSFSIAITFFAGHLQLAVLNTIFVTLYVMYRWSTTEKKQYKPLFFSLVFIFLGIAIASIQLIPTAELLYLSARTSQPYDFLMNVLLIQPKQLLQLFSPDIFGNPATRNYLLQDAYPGKAMYIGLLPLLFAVYAMSFARQRRENIFFISVVVALLLLLVNSPLTKLFYLIPLPLFSSSAPTNALYLMGFSLSILAGIGLEKWLEQKNKKIIIVFAGLLGLFLVGVTVVHSLQQAFYIKNAIYTLGLFGAGIMFTGIAYFLHKYKVWVGAVVILITVVDLFYFFHKFNPFVPKQLVYPETSITTWLQENADQHRFWGYGSAAIEANFSAQYQLYSPEGYDPLYPKRYGEFIQLSKKGKFPSTFTNRTRSDAFIHPGSGELDLPENEYRLRVLDMLGVRYIVDKVENGSTEKTFPSSRYQPVFKDGGWTIYENTQALPRVFFTASAQPHTDDTAIEKGLFNASSPRTRVFLGDSLPATGDEVTENNSISIKSYTPHEVMLRVASANQQVLVLTDTFYPGWNAYIDGKPTKMVPANYTFRAISVPAGDYHVVFKYEPFSFTLGMWMSIMSCIVLFLLVYLYGRFSYEK